MVKQIMRGTKGLFALDDSGKISFRRFREFDGDGTWRRYCGPKDCAKVVQMLLGSDGVFALLADGTIMRRQFGRSHRHNWKQYTGPLS